MKNKVDEKLKVYLKAMKEIKNLSETSQMTQGEWKSEIEKRGGAKLG